MGRGHDDGPAGRWAWQSDDDSEQRGGESQFQSQSQPQSQSRSREDAGGRIARGWPTPSSVPVAVRDVALGVVVFGFVAGVLFGVTGVWPPLVAVHSDSMAPQVQKGDLLVVTEPGRYMRAFEVHEPGVTTARRGRDLGTTTLGGYGSVIVYDPPADPGPPVVHRVQFYVARGENWYHAADSRYVRAESCRALRYCPAPHDGFITKGDGNPRYDQASGLSPPVKSQWIRGVARVRIPALGWGHVLLRDVLAPGTDR